MDYYRQLSLLKPFLKFQSIFVTVLEIGNELIMEQDMKPILQLFCMPFCDIDSDSFCLHKIQVLKPEDLKAVVIKVFWRYHEASHSGRYLQLMRTLQFAYWLEPAGSHGVWGLDDYHFLPFMFGSSQLHGYL
jgi:hypothetical protein